jgi:hypothetical protein
MLSPLLLPLIAPGSAMGASGIPALFPASTHAMDEADVNNNANNPAFYLEEMPPASPQPSFRPSGPADAEEALQPDGPACRGSHTRHTTWLWHLFAERRSGRVIPSGPENVCATHNAWEERDRV